MHECSVCKKHFPSSAILKSHRLRFHTIDVKLYKPVCGICNAIFKSFAALKAHSSLHKQLPETYECNKCRKTFKSCDDVEKHVQSHSSKNNVKIEIRDSESDIKKESLQCEVSHESVATGSSRKSEFVKLSNEESYECDYCFKMFDNSAFDLHVSQCTEKPVYSCHRCNASFETNSKLQNHIQTHEGRQNITSKKKSSGPYKCDVCEKSFNSIKFFRYHICFKRKATKAPEIEKRYKCRYCNKSFDYSTGLIVHERIHTGERPYKCSYCDKTFVQPSHCKVHERIHTGEKPFACTMCDKTFRLSERLQNHIEEHFNKQRYECRQCNMRFESELTLVCHNQTHAS